MLPGRKISRSQREEHTGARGHFLCSSMGRTFTGVPPYYSKQITKPCNLKCLLRPAPLPPHLQLLGWRDCESGLAPCFSPVMLFPTGLVRSRPLVVCSLDLTPASLCAHPELVSHALLKGQSLNVAVTPTLLCW